MPKSSPVGKSSASLGFPHLERLVEQESFEELNEVFITSYEKLERLAAAKGDAARKRAAKKSMRAMELTMDLLRDFLHVKEELISQNMEKEKNG